MVVILTPIVLMVGWNPREMIFKNIPTSTTSSGLISEASTASEDGKLGQNLSQEPGFGKNWGIHG